MRAHNGDVQPPAVVSIVADAVRADIAAVDGGRVAQIFVDGVELLKARTPDSPPTGWGSFPMVPWAGRIRRGRFTFNGSSYQLPINFEHHAIHGVGFTRPWMITARDDRSVGLRLDLPIDDSWPFGGLVDQHVGVDADGVTLQMRVTATQRAFPVSIGWHPWFRKPQRLHFSPTAMYRRDDDWITVDERIAVRNPPWDDCFVNTEPVGITIDGVELRLTSDCRTWVVYDMPDDATCIEPQTGPPDAFNIAVRRLEVGQSFGAWFRIERRARTATTPPTLVTEG